MMLSDAISDIAGEFALSQMDEEHRHEPSSKFLPKRSRKNFLVHYYASECELLSREIRKRKSVREG
jgi:hypothetical protein